MMEDNNMKDEQSLMKKTKEELVEIILRKNDVEKRLRGQLNALAKENAELGEQLSIMTKSTQTESCQGNEKQKHTNFLGFFMRLFGK